jgi:predicted small metal-binding protein
MEAIMSKRLRCSALFPECDHVIQGDSVQEILQKGAIHAAEEHGIEAMDADTIQKVQEAIEDV